MPIWVTLPETTGTPSTTYRGSFDAFIEPIPLTRIDDVAPACPDVVVICIPATLPFIAFSNDSVGTSLIASLFTTLAAPVNVPLVAVPYATTITSSSARASGLSIISITPLPLTGISCVE